MATLSELLCRMCDAALDFVIVGGFAEVAYTRGSIARSLEICAALNQSDIAKLRGVLRDLNPRYRQMSPMGSFLDTSIPTVGVRELRLETDAGTLDVVSSIPGVGEFDRVRLHAIEFAPFGRRCHLMSLDDLIRVREALALNTDFAVLNQLRALRDRRKRF